MKVKKNRKLTENKKCFTFQDMNTLIYSAYKLVGSNNPKKIGELNQINFKIICH
jgi:hypothetical protein